MIATRAPAFATATQTMLPLDRASVLVDGAVTEPRLNHPEGVAVGPDGFIWCGTETGRLLRIPSSGATIEVMADTGGFILGLAFEADQALYACDLHDKAVYRLDLNDYSLQRFTKPGISLPNYPLVDAAAGKLFVTDSRKLSAPGPAVWAYDLTTGDGKPWYTEPLDFANGLAMRSGERALYVSETFARCITRIPINKDGRAGVATSFVRDLPGLPDGLAFDSQDNLVIACYEPSRLLRVSPDGTDVQVLIEDPTAHVFCHPTNVAFADDILYSANLGRWHLTKVHMDIGAPPLWFQTVTEPT